MLTSSFVVLLLVGLLVPAWTDICDRRDKRLERGLWKGDIGDIQSNPQSMARDRLRLHHRRKRFLSFPTGSVLTVTPKLTIPWFSELNGDFTGSQLYAFPIELNLPNSTLRFISRPSNDMYGAYSKYSSGSHFDVPDHSDYPTYSSYSSYSSYSGRSLDHQRLNGFSLMQKALDNLGVNGQACVLRAVCGMANQNLDHLGLIGEMVKLFFSAGYGEGSDEAADYVAAEEAGRRQGSCQQKYPLCPMDLMDLLQAFVSPLRHGMTSINLAAATNSL